MRPVKLNRTFWRKFVSFFLIVLFLFSPPAAIVIYAQESGSGDTQTIPTQGTSTSTHDTTHTPTPTATSTPTSTPTGTPTATPTPASAVSPTPTTTPAPTPSVDPFDAPYTEASASGQPTADTTPTATPSLTPAPESTPAASVTPFDDSFDSVQPSLSPTATPVSSAYMRLPAKISALSKKHFKTNEKITFTIENTLGNPIKATLFDSRGAEVAVEMQKTVLDVATQLTLVPRYNLTPGKYILQVVDSQGTVSTQDFTWGVLALNTNKSAYAPGETAKIAIAVLDEAGMMVCDATVELTVTDPSGQSRKFSTKDGSIKVNPECKVHDFTTSPDYEASYTTSQTGWYKMSLSAQTANGSYTVDDEFEARASLSFDVERTSATRIYPPKEYPVNIKVKASEKFTGQIVEAVPESFVISPLSGVTPYNEVKVVSSLSLDGKPVGTGVVNIGLPFNGRYEQTLGFGDDVRDLYLVEQYTRFGLAGHDGIDFALPEGTPVLAVDSGEVVLSGEGAYGTTVVIQHSWGRSYYGHLSKLNVAKGQIVLKSTQIALSGSTGLSTGPHLHFGMKLTRHQLNNGYYGKTDPAPYLNANSYVSDYPVKTIVWNVSLGAGETVNLGYTYKAPLTSPQFYLAGPLKFMVGKTIAVPVLSTPESSGSAVSSLPVATSSAEASASANPFVLGTNTVQSAPTQVSAKSVLYQESRQWQIAADTPEYSLEQQVELINAATSVTSTDPHTQGRDLGMFSWDSADFSSTTSAQLEVVMKTSATTSQAIAALFDSNNNLVAQSRATVGSANTIATLDGCGECDWTDTTIYSSITLDSEGRPVIVYIAQPTSAGDGDLKLIYCGNANCTANNVVTTVDGCATCDNNLDIAKHTTVVLNSSGNPVISYYDETNGNLRLAICANRYCTNVDTYLVDDGGTDDTGTYAYLDLDSDGYPTITYYNATDTDLMIAKCSNAVCSSKTITVLDGCASGCDTRGAAGQYSTFEFDPTTGYPVISYKLGVYVSGDGDGYDMKLIRCGNAACSSGNTVTELDGGTSDIDSSGWYTSLKLDSNRYPVISFMRGDSTATMSAGFDLRLIHCNDVGCDPGVNGAESGVILDGQGATNCGAFNTSLCDDGDVGWYSELELDSNGYPVISYRSHVTGQLKVIHCNDANCTGNNESIERVDGCAGCDTPNGSVSQDGTGGYTGIVLDSNGYPVVVYRDVEGSEDLKVVHCGNPNCDFDGTGQVDPTNYQRVTSAQFMLNGQGYTSRTFMLRVWVNTGTATIKAARVRITQKNSTSITATGNQIELGGGETITATSYSELANPAYYYYDANKLNGTVTGYLEATLKGDKVQGSGRVWSSGFELNSTTAGIEFDTISGATSISSTTYRSGAYAGRVYAPSSASLFMRDFASSNQTADYYFRAYIYINAAPAGNRVILRIANSSGGSLVGVRLTTTRALQLLNLEDNQQVGSDSSALSTGTWYRIELRVDTTTLGSTTVNAKIDGSSFASGTINLATGQARLAVGSAAGAVSETLDIYFDDLAINNATGSWPGPGRIKHLRPNAAGDYSDWSNTYANVDEVTPDDATTIVASNTLNQIDDHNIDDSGLADNDDINVVSIGLRYNGAGASANASFKPRIKIQPYGAVEEGTEVTPASTSWTTDISPLTLYDLPGSSTTPWTKALLDAAQIGYRVSTGNTNNAQITAVWLIVDYNLNADLNSTDNIAAQVKLQQCDEASCSWTDVTNGTFTSYPQSFQLVRSSALTLVDDRRYRIVIQKSSSSGTVKIVNAKLILEQAIGGPVTSLTNFQLVQKMINTAVTDTDSTYTSQTYYNQYQPSNFKGATFAKYFEATIKTSAGTGYAQLYNNTGSSAITSSEVSTTSTSYTRQKSGVITGNMPSSAAAMDTQVKNSAASGNTTTVSNSWIIIEISDFSDSPALNQLMRHGRWFNDSGTLQPFTF